MSYLGLTRSLFNGAVKRIPYPVILEIGLDLGQTTLPIVQNLANSFDKFLYVGVDIRLRPEFTNQLMNYSGITATIGNHLIINDNPDKKVALYELNSLDFLKNINKELKFDFIWLDGDHNYYTVLNELKLLEQHVHDHTLIICDDYSGRYSDKNGYYSEYKGYEDNVHVTKKETVIRHSKKQGVKPAIDDFVESESKLNWSIQNTTNEPCVLYRHDKIDVAMASLDLKGTDILKNTSLHDVFLLKAKDESYQDFFK